jgi:glyoxylase-like metal-dependent hydrolase (beta-lactamase superfamily II)
MKTCFFAILFATPWLASAVEGVLPPGLKVETGSLNSVEITRNGKRLAVNRSLTSGPDLLLLTDARRDVVENARASAPVEVIASIRSKASLEEADAFWNAWRKDRFDYYGQQVTRWPVANFPATRYADPLTPEGREFLWEGLKILAIATPGYTRDGTAYFMDLDGVKVAFVGDLVLAGGKVRDLYSFQDEIREAKVGAYHGYLGRLGLWLESLEKVAAQSPDLIVSSRGAVSFVPGKDLASAAKDAREIYGNYLSTSALHWYFGEDRMKVCGDRILGPDHGVKGMPFAEHIDLPPWCRHLGTTKLLVSDSGKGFVLDVGGKTSLESLRQIRKDQLIQGIDGFFATHVHNDHTAAVAEASVEFGAPVYAVEEVADVLEHPGNWFLPGVSPNATGPVNRVADGEVMQWEEFTFTYRFYPGQMYNHGALLVEKPGHDPVLFVGDSFSPSGIDDYCLMNRNLMREDTGYARCFRILDELPPNSWLVNQHIPHLFRFSKEEKQFLRGQYKKRAGMISRWVTPDDLNYGLDEQWASFYPYAQNAIRGESVETEVRVWNHSTVERTFTVQLQAPIAGTIPAKSVTIPARERASISFTIPLPSDVANLFVVTADIRREDGREEKGFCETLIEIPGE